MFSLLWLALIMQCCLCEPTAQPTSPTIQPTWSPTIHPTVDPTQDPTKEPTTDPSTDPTLDPTMAPTFTPTSDPTNSPTSGPSFAPTPDPTVDPTVNPTTDPSSGPTTDPVPSPSTVPSFTPTESPSTLPTLIPTQEPTKSPTQPIATTTKADVCVDPKVCSDPFVCDVDADQFSTVSNYPCKRDCSLFAIDEYLEQCSGIFPATIEAGTARIENLTATVQDIQSAEIPAVAALAEGNTESIVDLAEAVSVIRNSTIADLEAQIRALSERVAFLENRVHGFESSTSSFAVGGDYVSGQDLVAVFSALTVLTCLLWAWRKCRGKQTVSYGKVAVCSDEQEAESGQELL